MSADMTLEPWKRLTKLAPPNTTTDDLQSAADRYSLTADLYAAAADLWEEAAMAVDTVTVDPSAEPTVQSVSQDGISVTYASDSLAGSGLSARVASQAQMLARARFFRSKAKAKT